MAHIAVLIPTKDRPESLKRALLSVTRQTKKPDTVLVISDCDSDREKEMQEVIREISDALPGVRSIRNQKTKNLSGAINTGLVHLMQDGILPESSFIATLDDDDEWEPRYLAECIRKANYQDLDLVISGIIRHEKNHDPGTRLCIPESLSAHDFFIGNPHVQGSNLFVRLSTLLEAGGFDEYLESTTDRDLCVRLLDLENCATGFVQEHLVHHCALAGMNRLSDPESPRKIQGLNAFYRKYCSRMTYPEREAFVERARVMFGCTIENKKKDCPVAEPGREIACRESEIDSYVPIIIGFFATRMDSTKNLLDDLIVFFGESKCRRKTIICDNTGKTADLDHLIRNERYHVLNISLISSATINEECSKGSFGTYHQEEERRKGISSGRTVLHHHLYKETLTLPGSAVWILDDDVRLEYLATGGQTDTLTLPEVQSVITRLKTEGVSIAVGKITGDAPLPVHSTIRTQLLDILSEIQGWKQSLKSSDHDTGRGLGEFFQNPENLIEEFPDYYYDYSVQHSSHLEFPFRSTVSKFPSCEDLIGAIPAMGYGKNITRPVTSAHPVLQSPFAKNTIIPRGGNTLVLNPTCLREFPNLSPRLGRLNARRGDTFWCVLNNRVKACKVGYFPLAVRQERTQENLQVSSFDSLIADFYGSAFVRAMDQHFAMKIQESGEIPRRIRLAINDEDIQLICSSFEKNLKGRLEQFYVNSYRIRGLIGAIEKILLEKPYSTYESTGKCRNFLSSLKHLYSEESVNRALFEGNTDHRDDLRIFLEQFKGYVKSYRHSLVQEISEDHIRHAKRVMERILIRKHGLQSMSLRYVGHGNEGAVFTDGTYAYKFFFTGLANFQGGRLDIIQKKILNNPSLNHMSFLHEIIEENGELVFVMSYEKGNNYSGGYLPAIFSILTECRNTGFAFTNFHPKNLIERNGTLKLVDIGDSIVPYNETEFLHMARRAYLTYRWHFRPDLIDLMNTSLYDPELPELSGFEYFFQTLVEKTKSQLVNQRVAEIIAGDNPVNIFDYGCGRGAIAELLAKRGFSVTGFDKDTAVLMRNRKNPVNANYLDAKGLAEVKRSGKRFDRVICSLVLCTICNDVECSEVMSDVRVLVADDGEALVAICNPFSSFVSESETHIKLDIPSDDRWYQKKFVYHKRTKETGQIRKEVHRPFSWYRHLFHKSGFEIITTDEIITADIWNLCPSSDFLLVRLKPLTVPECKNVSLLIRAGAMEWQTIDLQIRHIVRQLEGPHVFSEKIVVTDTFTGQFARPYAQADPSEFTKKLAVLKDEGIIDRIIIAPDDPSLIRQTSESWFGIPCENPRSQNSQPTFMSLYGIDQCNSDYILQMDSDCLIARLDRDHDYLGEMIDVLESDPHALTVSFNIAHDEDYPYTPDYQGDKWRSEVRCSLISKTRIKDALPLPNSVDTSGKLEHPWHRALDKKIQNSSFESYRGGNKKSFFIHVPNAIKSNTQLWYAALKSIEHQRIPACQVNSVDLKGSISDWVGSLSNDYIFIIRGKDVPVSKFRRCMDSVSRQKDTRFGIVFIDAGSSNAIPEYLEQIILPVLGARARSLFNLTPLSSAENNVVAIRDLCSNPQSVIITLDADDALIGSHIIEFLNQAYQEGADLTVGSMLRTDKWCEYPVNLSDPRHARGGNVWQHLRSFRKYLFDAIPVSYLKIDDDWIPIAEDWAFMLPLVELAQHPVNLEKKMYLYEPAGKKDETTRAFREDIIGKIMKKNSLKGKRTPVDGGCV